MKNNSSSSADAGNRLKALETSYNREPFLQKLSKPSTLIGLFFGVLVCAGVWYLQSDSRLTTLEPPDVQYQLLQNRGVTNGVPIAIQMGPLTLFEINDNMAGGGGADRARQVVQNLQDSITELVESPGRVITIEVAVEDEMPRIVQKEELDSPESLEIIQVTAEDMALSYTEDAKLLARVWAERLTDGLRLLVFAEPPEFSRNSKFGMALDTLYVNARSVGGALSSNKLTDAFKNLSDTLRSDLTNFPSPLVPDEEPVLNSSQTDSPLTAPL